MRIFVASWFFPPATSSEGIVTYKLLRNSEHEYDVCSAMSNKWGYNQEIPLEASNIRAFPIKTDSMERWVEGAIKTFFENHAQIPYDAVMTRTMPPESILVAKAIKAEYPDLPWIASFGDPIAKSPFDILNWVENSPVFSEDEKSKLMFDLFGSMDDWRSHESREIQTMLRFQDWEDYAINKASALIFPSDIQKHYMLNGRRRKNALTVPHSFDPSLYPEPATPEEEKIVFSFLGHSNAQRSLKPFVEALHVLGERSETALKNIHVRFIGNVPEDIRSLVNNYYLYDVVSIENSVSYLESLRIMQESDWLLHVDTYFDFLEKTGGSIFFAGKLADYMGTDKPIFALTGRHSPADHMVRNAGGVSINPLEICDIANAFELIATGKLAGSPDLLYRGAFDSRFVAQHLDKELEAVVEKRGVTISRTAWPHPARIHKDNPKLVTICVPSYKVEMYLDRCLFSLVSCRYADYLEVLIVNDGSPDSSRDIALTYQERYPGIVSLIDKENGGHGSTINTALALATGVYFRVIDGDDWVDSANFDGLIERMLNDRVDADLVFSNYHQVYAKDGNMVPWTKGSSAAYYQIHPFDSLDLEHEYFTIHGTMFKTEVLRASHMNIQEHTFYVDTEYILFPIPYVQTVYYYPNSIYRYAVGNAEQSIHIPNFVKRYDHHDRVMKRLIEYYESTKDQMGASQRRYFEILFKRNLFETHYLLSLVWDKDKARGCKRAREFDEFLRAADADFYEYCGKQYQAVRAARRSQYNPEKMKKWVDLHAKARFSGVKQGIRKCARAMGRTKIGKKLAYNRLTDKFYARFFMQ